MSSAITFLYNEELPVVVNALLVYAACTFVYLLVTFYFTRWHAAGPSLFWKSELIDLEEARRAATRSSSPKTASSVVRIRSILKRNKPSSPKKGTEREEQREVPSPMEVAAPAVVPLTYRTKPICQRWSEVVLHTAPINGIQTIRGAITGTVCYGTMAIQILFAIAYFDDRGAGKTFESSFLIASVVAVVTTMSLVFIVQNLRMTYHLNYLVMVLPRREKTREELESEALGLEVGIEEHVLSEMKRQREARLQREVILMSSQPVPLDATVERAPEPREEVRTEFQPTPQPAEGVKHAVGENEQELRPGAPPQAGGNAVVGLDESLSHLPMLQTLSTQSTETSLHSEPRVHAAATAESSAVESEDCSGGGVLKRRGTLRQVFEAALHSPRIADRADTTDALDLRAVRDQPDPSHDLATAASPDAPQRSPLCLSKSFSSAIDVIDVALPAALQTSQSATRRRVLVASPLASPKQQVELSDNCAPAAGCHRQGPHIATGGEEGEQQRNMSYVLSAIRRQFSGASSQDREATAPRSSSASDKHRRTSSLSGQVHVQAVDDVTRDSHHGHRAFGSGHHPKKAKVRLNQLAIANMLVGAPQATPDQPSRATSAKLVAATAARVLPSRHKSHSAAELSALATFAPDKTGSDTGGSTHTSRSTTPHPQSVGSLESKNTSFFSSFFARDHNNTTQQSVPNSSGGDRSVASHHSRTLSGQHQQQQPASQARREAAELEHAAKLIAHLRVEEELNHRQHELRLGEVLRLMSVNYAMGFRLLILLIPPLMGMFGGGFLMLATPLTIATLVYIDKSVT